jgi:hypothetical protein
MQKLTYSLCSAVSAIVSGFLRFSGIAADAVKSEEMPAAVCSGLSGSMLARRITFSSPQPPNLRKLRCSLPARSLQYGTNPNF